MKIIFFGSSDFAYRSLEELIKNKLDICAIVTQPDRPHGRHLKLEPSKIKLLASKFKVSVFQPQDLNTEEAFNFLKKQEADLFIVISYGKILTKDIISIPKNFSINLHASLLPKYRGAAPINWALINGEKETGVTIIKINEKMDAGPIILQEKIIIDKDDNAVSLKNKLSEIGASLLIKSIDLIKNNKFSLTQQDENEASFAPKIKKNNGLIIWDKNALEIHNQIRGYYGWPGSFTYWKNKLLKIYKTELNDNNNFLKDKIPGTVGNINKEGIFIITRKNIIIIKELQLESSKRMSAGDFVSGHKIKVGDIFG